MPIDPWAARASPPTSGPADGSELVAPVASAGGAAPATGIPADVATSGGAGAVWIGMPPSGRTASTSLGDLAASPLGSFLRHQGRNMS